MPALAGAIINTYLRISYDTHYDLLRGYIQTGEQKLAGNIAEHYQTTMALVIREAHVASFIDGFDLIMLLVILGALCMSFLKSSPENPVVPRLVK
ncbi:hypothetical protein [Proteus mirabilis]|nr:hypothetical protein [Proteus mirabilis]AGS61541.1 multidrug efflux protein (MFS-family transporter) [Proteus mirabilis BB2000]